MKRIKLYSILLILILFLNSCNFQEEKAKRAIKKYTKELFKEYKYDMKPVRFSKLYIIEPKDNEKVPKFTTSDIGENLMQYMELNGTALFLSLKKCDVELMNSIIENDKKFEKWGTGGKRFVMVCFFEGKDDQGIDGHFGTIFKIDSVLQIEKMYFIDDEQEIFNKISLK